MRFLGKELDKSLIKCFKVGLTKMQKKEKVCKVLKCKGNDIRAFGVCHRHYELYRKGKERLARHQKRVNDILVVREVIEGKQKLKMDISGTNWVQ